MQDSSTSYTHHSVNLLIVYIYIYIYIYTYIYIYIHIVFTTEEFFEVGIKN